VPSGAVRAICARLVDYLPPTLAGNASRVISPRSPLVHVWGDPPIVLRCGVPRPAGYDPASAEATVVNGVHWFQQIGTDDVTWTAIRRGVNLELTVPKSYDAQGAFLVALGASIDKTIP
jgi:hypothetical protein